MFSIFFLVFFGLGLGILLAVFISRTSDQDTAPRVPPEKDADNDSPLPPLTLEDLYPLGERLCRESGLEIVDRQKQSDHEMYWIAESKNEFFEGSYLVAFFEVHPEMRHVTLSKILEFKDYLKSIQCSKGLFLTTGFFTRDVHQPLEGPKVTLYNRLKVLEGLDKN